MSTAALVAGGAGGAAEGAATGAGAGAGEDSAAKVKVNIKNWHAVASWTWDAQDDACGICRMPFDGCCPDCKMPGDDCPLILGKCTHAFHLHCILKWVQAQAPRPQCPMCRREWKFQSS